MHAIDVNGLDGGHVHLTIDDLHEIEGQIAGALLAPGDAGWDSAIEIWNGMAASTPALVAQPTSAADVAEIVRFAGRHRLLLTVRGGGHNIAGTAIADGALTIDLARMATVDVDPESQVAHVGPGCRLRDVDAATQAHGLATVLGFVGDTGVAGLTLGGGLGYLTRRFGWTVDNLVEVEVVTADGQTLVADREHHPDLFWALRGGGGNFGVVTRFTFRLHPVGPTIVGGLIAWPFARAGEILDAYRRITAQAPRELAVWMNLLHAPPAPFVPEALHLQPVCAAVVCYSGAPERADEALAPIRALADPALDLVGEMPYAELQSMLDDGEPRGAHYYWKTQYLGGLSDDLLATARELFAECPVPGAEIGFLHLAGAVNERPADDGAVGNRDAAYAMGVNGMWEPDEPDADLYVSWIRDAAKRLEPFTLGRTYINFQTADEDERAVRATYGDNYERLGAVKRRYDPGNLFRVNRNITPA